MNIFKEYDWVFIFIIGIIICFVDVFIESLTILSVIGVVSVIMALWKWSKREM